VSDLLNFLEGVINKDKPLEDASPPKEEVEEEQPIEAVVAEILPSEEPAEEISPLEEVVAEPAEVPPPEEVVAEIPPPKEEVPEELAEASSFQAKDPYFFLDEHRRNIKLIEESGLEYKKFSRQHYRVEGSFDFWPSTGKWIKKGNHLDFGQGINSLAERIRQEKAED